MLRTNTIARAADFGGEPTTYYPAVQAAAEARPTWADAAKAARDVRQSFGLTPAYAYTETMHALARKTAGLARSKAIHAEKLYDVVRLSEQLALDVAIDPKGYLNYAINPEGVAEFATKVSTVQGLIRELSRGSGALSVAFEEVWAKSPNSRRGQHAEASARPCDRDTTRVMWIAQRLEHLQAQEQTCKGDEAASERRHAEISRLENELRTVACTSHESALVMLRAIRLGLEDGEFVGDDAMFDKVLAFLHRQAPTQVAAAGDDDPVIPLISRAVELGHLEGSASDLDAEIAYGDERDAQEVAASKVQATTLAGTAGQLAFAMHQIELIRGCGSQEDRDRYHGQAEDLIRSALTVLADHISPELWTTYVGGYHPHTAPPLAIAAE